MRTNILRQTALLAMLMLPTAIFAQWYEWAIAVKEVGQDKPVVTNYSTYAETASNGVRYGRIQILTQQENRWDWIPQQYGVLYAEKKILVYDYKNEKELVAFDFDLSVGEEFTTINGMNWVVKEVSDTVIYDRNLAISQGLEPCRLNLRLLKVETTDGTRTDQWLEEFGSFSNHLMLTGLEGIDYAITPWIYSPSTEKEEGATPRCYIAREFSCDPIFGHDTGWLQGLSSGNDKDSFPSTISYENGVVTVEDHVLSYPCRYYSLFYRENDDFYLLCDWEFQPHIDGGESFWATDKMVFEGLPEPTSGAYTLHYGDKDITTNIEQMKSANFPSGSFDLQGRRLKEEPQQGIFIKAGRIVNR